MPIESEYLEFQAVDWTSYHRELGDEEKFTIRVYGKTNEAESVYVRIDGYTPYFYVEIPRGWNKSTISLFVSEIGRRVRKPEHKQYLINYDVVERYSFWKFQEEKKTKLLRLIFSNHDAFRSYERVLRKKVYNRLLSRQPKKYRLYESNIAPMLRCMHIRKLSACGWIKIHKSKLKKLDPGEDSKCTHSYSTKWTNLNPIDKHEITAFTIASFDIECTSEDGNFPQATRDGDKVIQIGTSISRYGESECFFKHIVTLGSCDPIPGVEVESYNTEADVLVAWSKMINKLNPDIMTGYNIFGFDFKYLHDRAKKLGVEKRFSEMCRIKYKRTPWVEKDLSSSALGDNKLYYYAPDGRVVMDLMKVIQRDFKLESYKLDYAASYFIREKFKPKEMTFANGRTTIKTSNANSVRPGFYITINYNDGLTDNRFKEGRKYRVDEIPDNNTLILDEIVTDEDGIFNKPGNKYFWSQAKDDVTPQEIFQCQDGTAKDRARIAKYCVQDCALCNRLINKLQILTNNIGMANVCSVPLSYLFLRGQGVKIFSLVAKKCRELGYVIPVVRKKQKFDNDQQKFEKALNDNIYRRIYQKEDDEEDGEEDEDGYEGATVFPPDKGVHFDPIPVLDYASLYPSAMIHRNVSHECLLDEEQYVRYRDLCNRYKTMDQKKFSDHKVHSSNEVELYEIMKEYGFHKVTYRNNKGPDTVCYYAQKKGELGILPMILNDLLSARKATKKAMAMETDPFKKAILNGLQLAFKVTANSLYGQTGASTSPIFLKDVAASTTATGREMLTYAKRFTERVFVVLVDLIHRNKPNRYRKYMRRLFKLDTGIIEEGIPFYENDETHQTTQDIIDSIFIDKVVDKTKFNDKKGRFTDEESFIDWFWDEIRPWVLKHTTDPKIIYGDTDSIFINMNIRKKKTKEKVQDDFARKMAIRLGILCGELIKIVLPNPHDLEYEKTFHPFCIISKKRYVGNLYEEDPNDFKQKSMGIVLKRRDNAPIVKIVCGGIVDKILNEHSGSKAVEYTKYILKEILCKRYPMEKFILTKTLRGFYKDRTKIPHAVLRDRIAMREPGNEPQSNDRIPYAYIETKHLRCKACNEKVDIERCKCRKCMGMFCPRHLHNHRDSCQAKCRLSGDTKESRLTRCDICRGWYSQEKNPDGETYFKFHKRREDKETGEVFYNKCKNQLSESILQGDIIETPTHIIKNKMHIDYLFYITNQIMKPALQFLELIAVHPEKIFNHYIMREMNRREGKKPLGYYFKDDETPEVSHTGFEVALEDTFDPVSFEESKPKRRIKRKVHKPDKATWIKTSNVSFNPENDFMMSDSQDSGSSSMKKLVKKKPAKKKQIMKPKISSPAMDADGDIVIEDFF